MFTVFEKPQALAHNLRSRPVFSAVETLFDEPFQFGGWEKTPALSRMPALQRVPDQAVPATPRRPVIQSS